MPLPHMHTDMHKAPSRCRPHFLLILPPNQHLADFSFYCALLLQGKYAAHSLALAMLLMAGEGGNVTPMAGFAVLALEVIHLEGWRP